MRFIYCLLVCGALWLSSGVASGKVYLKNATSLDVDARYDTLLNVKMSRVLTKYQQAMQNQVERRIGIVSQAMTAKAPESLLSNLLSDVLYQEAQLLMVDTLDIALINLSGIRSSLAKGTLTVGDIYRVMPFENELVILELSGTDVETLLNRIAKSGGEGLSNVQLVASNDKARFIRIGGKMLEPKKTYRLATMDYLADGSGGMTVLQKAIGRVNTGIKVRDLYLRGLERIALKVGTIDSRLDGRIQLEPKQP